MDSISPMVSPMGPRSLSPSPNGPHSRSPMGSPMGPRSASPMARSSHASSHALSPVTEIMSSLQSRDPRVISIPVRSRRSLLQPNSPGLTDSRSLGTMRIALRED
jgi:hypothetical protein